MAQSTNDSSLGHGDRGRGRGPVAALPAIAALQGAIAVKAEAWADIVKIGRTHLQDATPMTLRQEFSGYAAIGDNCERLESALAGVYRLPLGGTAIGTGVNAPKGFAEARSPRSRG